MVSIIIPNYNHAHFLKQRIESILNQTYQKFEIILLDDCSSDDSKEVIETYRNNPKVSRIIYNEENSGSPFKQWEKGISIASAEFIWIAETDDWAEPTFLEKLVPVIESNPKIGLVYCDSYVFENDQKKSKFSEMNNDFMKMKKWSSDYNIEGHKELENLSHVCTINNASAVLFRRSSLQEVFPMNHFFRFMGDWFTYINIANSFRIAYIALPLNNYRYHSTNVSKQVNSQLNFVRERFIISNYLLARCPYLDKKKQIKNLYDYTFHSVNLKKENILLYKDLIKINPRLLYTLIRYNIISAIKIRLKRLL